MLLRASLEQLQQAHELDPVYPDLLSERMTLAPLRNRFATLLVELPRALF